MHTCKNCQKPFEIEDWDRQFYAKMDVTEPTLCPDCRTQRRQAHINQINLFKRNCDATGETIITNYPPDSPYKVYAQKFWFSEAFDVIDLGRDFDFNKPFFEQFDELSKIVPRPALTTDFNRDENSAYTNCAGKNKNCYLIFDSDENWDCYYSFGTNSSQDSCDCYRAQKLQLCYEAVDSANCYNSSFIQNCENCYDSAFLQNCIGCRDCYFSSNLQRKENYIFNKPATKEECESFKYYLGSHKFIDEKRREFADYKLKFPQKFQHGFHNENVSGDYLVHCKDAHETYDSMNVWDAKYCIKMFIKAKTCMDTDEGGEAEMLYECMCSGYNLNNLRFCMYCFDEISNLTYCDTCWNGCSNLFGCVGLKRKQYCILNKQYSKEEYEALVPRIIEHMKKTGEWGEFFPIKLSSFPYNLTRAQDNFSLTKEQAEALGYKWHDEDTKAYKKQTCEVPDLIKDVPDDICNETLACETCGKNFKIVPQELKLYKQINIPVPTKCFYCRHKVRKGLRNARHLWKRNCKKCGLDINTTYSPENPAIVYCEKCYQESLF
ncbi:MAG: hypothetical protein WCT53_00065 [Candidatus Gracilibacteria bacterium]